ARHGRAGRRYPAGRRERERVPHGSPVGSVSERPLPPRRSRGDAGGRDRGARGRRAGGPGSLPRAVGVGSSGAPRLPERALGGTRALDGPTALGLLYSTVVWRR